MSAEPLLSLRDVTIAYGRAIAVRALSLDVHVGEIVAILGANGAGKTTTLRCISGLLRPAQGTVRFRGEDLAPHSAAEIVHLGVSHVPEGRRIFPQLTVADNLELGAYFAPKPELRRRLQRVMDIFPVLAERAGQNAGTLSGGEQQMLAIGRALMAEPKLLLLDEPSLGLAPLVVEAVFERLSGVLKGSVTMLLVEQNARLALETADRAYVLERGELVCSGTSAAVAADERVHRAYLGDDEPDAAEEQP